MNAQRSGSAAGWADRHGRALADALLLLSPPVNLAMTVALRRVARLKPGVFERLGGFSEATYLICPAELPVAFCLRPHPVRGQVRVAPRETPATARISGPLIELLGLFDGSLDADSAFFARTLEVEGDTGAVVALHNALEAAELSLADILATPAFAAPPVNRSLEFLLRTARRFSLAKA